MSSNDDISDFKEFELGDGVKIRVDKYTNIQLVYGDKPTEWISCPKNMMAYFPFLNLVHPES